MHSPQSLLCDLHNIPASPAAVVVLYPQAISHELFSFIPLGRSLSLHLLGQKEQENIFHLPSQDAAESSWALPHLPSFCVKMVVKALLLHYLPQAPPRALGTRGRGERLCFCPPVFLLCFPRFAGAWKAANQNCQPGLEIARRGKVSRRYRAKI